MDHNNSPHKTSQHYNKSVDIIVEEMTQFLTNCTSLSLTQLKSKNMAISISAMICFFLTGIILLLLVIHRAYKTTLQRFFQCLTIVTLLHLAFISMDIQLQSNSSHGPKLCQWLGFIRQWTATMTYFFVLVITVYLVHRVYHHLKNTLSSSLPKPTISRVSYEAAVVVTVVLLPLTFLWVPFYHHTYGIYATSCWIQKIDRHCNKSIGSIDQIAFVSVLRIVMIVVIISFSILSVFSCWFARKYRQSRKMHLRTIRQTLLLMSSFLVSSLIEITGLLMYSYTEITGKDVESYRFWLVYDIAMPFSQLIIPTGFLVYLYTFNNLRCEAMRKAISEWRTCCTGCCIACCTHIRDSRASSDPRQGLLSKEVASAPTSTRVSALSTTFFSIKHTGGFTDISSAVVTTGNQDTGYGSIV